MASDRGNSKSHYTGSHRGRLKGGRPAGSRNSGVLCIRGKIDKWPSGKFRLTSSATSSCSQALSCIPFEKGDQVLITNEDYISNQLAFLSIQKRWNVQLVRAASRREGRVDVGDMERLMDIHHPKLVSVTHVPTNSGLVQWQRSGNFAVLETSYESNRYFFILNHSVDLLLGSDQFRKLEHWPLRH